MTADLTTKSLCKHITGDAIA